MWSYVTMAILALLVNNALSRPADEPTKITLSSTYSTTESPGTILSKLQQGEGIVSDAQNNIASIVVAKTSAVKARSATSVPSYEAAPFAKYLPPKTRETVKLESAGEQAFFENPGHKPVESVLQNYLKPTPIVDGIKEHEKYGNSGDHFSTIGRALVNGFESLSNLLNNIVQGPKNAARKTSRGITDALNQLGSKLVGLQ